MGHVIFFWPWPTWAKLGFVLGGCLILVLILASLFKVRAMFRLKRLLKKKRADLETADLRLSARSLDGIPFGDKAMLEDPEVEGVWNSRASTPLQSPVLGPQSCSPSRKSINLFSRSRRNSSISSLTNLNIAETTTVPQTPSDSNHSSVALVSTGSTAVATNPRRRSVTIRATSTHDLISISSKHGEVSVCSNSSFRTRRSRVSTDPGSSTPVSEHRGRTLVIGGCSKNSSSVERTPTTKKALARMEEHRKFHAAESGQLQPRLRPLGENIHRHKHTNSDNMLTGPEAARAVSWPITPGETLVINYNAPHKVQTKMSPPVVPFRAHIETDPTRKLPPSAWTDRTQCLLDEKLGAQTIKRRVTITNDDDGELSNEQFPTSDQKGMNDEEEKVSLLGTQQRKVNNGFEILPAGTLQDEKFAKEFGFLGEPLRETSNEITRPRKLQKRSRSTSKDRRISLENVRRIAT